MSNETKQTGLDLLIEQFIKQRIIIVNKTTYDIKYTHEIILEQAKAMHKEEMINFGNDLLAQNDINYIGVPNLAEQYYNEIQEVTNETIHRRRNCKFFKKRIFR